MYSPSLAAIFPYLTTNIIITSIQKFRFGVKSLLSQASKTIKCTVINFIYKGGHPSVRGSHNTSGSRKGFN